MRTPARPGRPPTGTELRLPGSLGRTAVVVIAAVYAGILLWRAGSMLGTVATTVAVSWFLAMALDPMVSALARRGMRRTAATGLVMAGSIVVAAGLLAAFGSILIGQLIDLVRSLPSVYDSLRDWAERSIGLTLPSSQEALGTAVQRWGDDLAGTLLGVSGSVVSLLLGGLAVLLVTYYIASAEPRFRQAVCRLLPPARQHDVLRTWEVAQHKVADFLATRIALAALSSVFTSVFLLIAGVPYALALGLFTGVVSQFVPTIGTYIGGALPAMVALSVSPWTAVAVVVFVVIYQQVENLVFSPRLSARSLHLNPAVAFLAVLAGGAVFGALGAFMALPVAATVQAVATTSLRRHELVTSPMLADDPAPRSHRRGDAGPAPAAVD